MATYEGSAYELLSNIRRQLNEYSTAYVQGTDTSGAYDNSFLRDQINDAQKQLYAILMRFMPEEFLTSVSITGSSSVFTLPWNFAKVAEFRDDKGYKVYPAPFRHLPPNSQLSASSDRFYYRKGQTLVLFKSGVNKTYTLWYYKKPREIHSGKASAGGAQTMTLDATYAKKIADYYVGMDIGRVTADAVDTITAYTAARVATISGTSAANNYYGIVSELPDAFHHLIAPRAAMLAAMRSSNSEEKPTAIDLMVWNEAVNDTLLAFGVNDDVRPEDLWCDFGGGSGGGGIDIPGQGYLI